MIVQNAAKGAPHFVMTMDQHTALSAQFALNFGTDEFEPVSPAEQVLFVIGNHDAGWRELDRQALRDPNTGLPYNLVQTPFEHILRTSSLSPDANGERHPYCELLSSMHSWGLYNGRYGMSDKVLLDGLAGDNRQAADAMLASELERQQRLKAQLAAHAESATWVSEEHLFQNYKQLQFFDTLALYFNCEREGERQATSFAHVPGNSKADATITIRPCAPGVYQLNPYPFAADHLEVSFSGRYLKPVGSGSDVRNELEAATLATQSVMLKRESAH